MATNTVFKNGILLLSHLPNEITLRKCVKVASTFVTDNLMLHLSHEKHSGAHEQRCNQYEFLRLVYGKNICEKPDLHVLLSPIENYGDNNTLIIPEICLHDESDDNENIKTFFKNIPYKNIDVEITSQKTDQTTNQVPEKNYSGVVIGGTFDHIHNGHKLLLATALLMADDKITVGVADGILLKNKVLSELIEPVHTRMNAIGDLIGLYKPALAKKIVPITDPCGPSGTDDDLQLLVVSNETLKGGNVVNEKRMENQLDRLDVFAIDIIDEEESSILSESLSMEKKLSSSFERIKSLGTLRKQPNELPQNRNTYVIGITGGIASGKSTIVEYLKELGVYAINCDKLGHEAYLPGQPAFNKIIENFGEDILADDGTINRKKLGPIVFSDKSKLELLNNIVWPEIRRMRNEIIDKICKDQSHEIVVFEGAILFEAGWDSDANEVWCCVIPENEAVKRIKSRDGIPEENALRRIRSQLSNEERVSRSHVVFCSQWEYEFTRQQVERAWNLLCKRLDKHNLSFKGNL